MVMKGLTVQTLFSLSQVCVPVHLKAPAASGVSDTASLAPRSSPLVRDLGEVRQLDSPHHVVPDPSVEDASVYTGAHKPVAEAPHVHSSTSSSQSGVMSTSQEPQRTASTLLSEQLTLSRVTWRPVDG
ncbi:hypothetical protein BDR07DRAFT_1490928 [Suillus spraguei]|nr:hypothetical protein BDR07DRAFT_1490928 [Suillus spraguei]